MRLVGTGWAIGGPLLSSGALRTRSQERGTRRHEEQSAPPALALAPKFSRYRVLYTLCIAIGYKEEFPVLDGPFLQQTHEF